MEDVEEKPTSESSESSSTNAEARPLAETLEENTDMINPEPVALEDCFHRQHSSSDVDNLMELSTSSSETKEMQEADVHVAEQNHQEAVANNELKIDLPRTKSTDDNIALGAVDPQTTAKQIAEDRTIIDTAAPFESVKEAVSKFGEIVNWKPPRMQTVEIPSALQIAFLPMEDVEEKPTSESSSTNAEAMPLTETLEENTVMINPEPVALKHCFHRHNSSNDVDNLMELSTSKEAVANNELKIDLRRTKSTDNIALGAVDPQTTAKQIAADRTIIDTAAPFESVKEAVSKFGEIANWKPPRMQPVERREEVEQELEKANEEIPQYQKRSEAAEEAKVQVLKELDSAKRLIEELKLNLERAQIEERQAKQDSELAKLRVEEMEQGVAEDSSVAAKAQLEVAKARYTTAIKELESVKKEVEKLRKEYPIAVTEKDEVMKKAEDAVAESKQVEKTLEDLTIELIDTKESFETAHAAHMEEEEHRIGKVMARDQDFLNMEKELKQAEAELEGLNQKILSAKDLKSKLSKASDLLLDLRAELNAYMKRDLEQQENETQNEIQVAVASAKKELEEVKLKIEKVVAEVDYLKVAETSLRSELEQEKSNLASLRQRHRLAAITIEELDKTRPEIVLVKAAEEAKQANLLAQAAREEQQIVKEEAKQAKAVASTMKNRLLVVQKEIEAAKASERLAIAAIKALHESESARSNNEVDSINSVVILSVEEYYQLSKQAHEAEEKVNVTVTTTNSEIEMAKESELKALEKLNEVNKEMAARRESLKIAMDKDEKAKDEQLGVEEQLRKLRDEQVVNQNSSKSGSFDSSKEPNNGTGSSTDAKAGKKKKKKRTLYKLSLAINCKN